MRRYRIVIERGPTNYAGYVPDLPICFAVGDSPEEVESSLRDAIEAHLEALKDFGLPIPEPSDEIIDESSQIQTRLIEVAV